MSPASLAPGVARCDCEPDGVRVLPHRGATLGGAALRADVAWRRPAPGRPASAGPEQRALRARRRAARRPRARGSASRPRRCPPARRRPSCADALSYTALSELERCGYRLLPRTRARAPGARAARPRQRAYGAPAGRARARGARAQAARAVDFARRRRAAPERWTTRARARRARRRARARRDHRRCCGAVVRAAAPGAAARPVHAWPPQQRCTREYPFAFVLGPARSRC